MITKTIECEGAVVTIRRQTHQTRLMALHLRSLFGEVYPEFKEAYEQMQIRNIDEILQGFAPAQGQLFLFTMEFAGYCGSILSASGLPFDWPLPGVLPSKEWLKTAFTHFLESGDEDGIWAEIERGLGDLEKPAGPKETWPEQALAREELADPN